MRKLFFLILTFTLICNVFSQDNNIGITGGLLNVGEKFKTESLTSTTSNTGFYLGLNYRIPLDAKFAFNPEINYANAGSSFGILSARLNYYPFDKFFIQGGPQFSYFFNDLGDGFKQGGIDFSFGLGYELSEKFYVQSRYSFELTNRSNLDIDDVSTKLSWLFVGIGYNF